MSFLRIRELVRKEFLQLFRDKRNRVLLFVAPLIQLLVFGYVVNYDIRYIRVALIDYSRTAESRSLADDFTGSSIFHITHYLSNEQQMTDLLLKGRVDMAVTIPSGFAGDIRKGKTSPVQIIADGSMSNMAAMRVAYAATVIDTFNRKTLRDLYPQRMNYGRVDARVRTWYNPNLDSQYFFVPGIVSFLVMLTSLLLTSIAIIREKEIGTMEQIIVTPIKSYEFIMGKTIPYIMVSLAQMIFVVIFAVFWFSIPMKGSLLLLFITTILFLMSTLGIGLFISTIASTRQQAMMTAFFVLLPFLLLSGFIFPVANMPQMVQWITYLNPLRFFLVIIRGIFLKGVGMEVLWPQVLALTLLGTVMFAGAIVRFKKRLD